MLKLFCSWATLCLCVLWPLPNRIRRDITSPQGPCRSLSSLAACSRLLSWLSVNFTPQPSTDKAHTVLSAGKTHGQTFRVSERCSSRVAKCSACTCYWALGHKSVINQTDIIPNAHYFNDTHAENILRGLHVCIVATPVCDASPGDYS